MSNHLFSHTGQDRPSQSYRHQADQSKMGYEGDLGPYSDPEAHDGHYREQDVVDYYHSVNDSAVKSNSYMQFPDWNGGRLPTSLSQTNYNEHSSRPKPRRGSPVYGSRPSPGSLQPSPQLTSIQNRGLQLQSSVQNPSLEIHDNDRGRTIENDHSDLEEGELSEGPDDDDLFKAQGLDLSLTTEPRQLNTNGEGHQFILRSDQRGSPYPDQSKNMASNDIYRPVREGLPQSVPSVIGVTYKAGSRKTQNGLHKTSTHPDKGQSNDVSVQPTQDRAIHALKELQGHNIGYAQLLAEHLHAEYLRKLYNALGVKINQHTEASKDFTNFPSHKTRFEPTPSASNVPANGSSLGSAGAAVITSIPTAQSMSDRIPEQRVDLDQSTALSSNRASQDHSKPSQAQRTVLEKSGISDKPASQINVGSSVGLTTESPSETLPMSAPSTHNSQLAATQILPQKPTQKAAIEATTKPPALNAAVKTSDRKDYIARLLAAKAGKPVPAMSTPRPPLDVASNKKPDLFSKHKNQAIEVLEKETQSSSSNPSQDNCLVLPDAPMKSTAVPNPAAEAKRREQTELARRKIEELKKRAREATEVRSPISGMPAMSGVENNLQSSESSMKNPAKPVVRLIPGLQVSQNLPQHSYFSPHKGSFTIPGLFMSPPQGQPDGSIEPPHVATAQDSSFDSARANAKPGTALMTDSLSPQSDIVLETSIPSTCKEEPLVKTSLGETGPSKVTINVRKRPTAADFIESLPSKVRKADHRKADNSVIIEVSDDEWGDSGSEDSNMRPRNDGVLEDTLMSRPASKAQTHGSSSPQSDFQVTLEQGNNLRSNAGQSLPKSFKNKDPAGLRSKEEEIERMNRKIAEMEQRRKARQSTALKQVSEILAQPASNLQPSDTVAAAQVASSTEQHNSQPANMIQAEIPKPEIDRDAEPIPLKEVSNEEPSIIPRQTGTLESTGEDSEGAVVATEEQQHPPQGTDVTSNVRSNDAAVQMIMAQLQSVQKEEADLQVQVQRMIDTKRSLQKELEQLKQQPPSSPRVPEHLFAETAASETARECNRQGRSFSPHTNQDNQQAPTQPVADQGDEPHRRGSSRVNEADTASERSTPPTPIAALRADAPINQLLISNEQAEDVMDISRSEDEGLVAEHDSLPNADRGPLANDSSDEEPYEPPASFPNIEEDLLVGTDSKQPDTRSRETSEPLNPRASDVWLSVESKPKEGGQPSVTDAVGAALEPRRPQSAGHLSESDDYEPPEPTTPVEAASVTHTAADHLSASSSIAPLPDAIVEAKPTSLDSHSARVVQTAVDEPGGASDASEKIPMSSGIDGHARFAPYESPLQGFHAYRYHPEFVSKVGNGYRSLTYSNAVDVQKPICPYEIGGRCNDTSCKNQHFREMNLSDDMILVQMGTVPEGLSPEQRNIFVVGLRRIIQEIRGRKVKDFKTVASEIAAYRARFLGDESKILPL
ncbi:MAG: hypothetical protein Q9228_000400 [Teloschistes exilis]